MTISSQKPVILIDGSSYLYRAFHALPALMNSKGSYTGAIYGMIAMLKKLIADYQPSQIAVIFDTKGKTFRDALYPAYKATRKEMPMELVQQIKPIHDIIRALGLPLVAIDGVEADDVIGTLADQAIASKHPVLISTGDKDMAQLVNDHITLINTMTNVVLNETGVKEKFGCTPAQIIDYLMLIGDSSDNIPGVPQVGPKTAVKWLQEYGSLDDIIKNSDAIKGKVGENLRATLPQFPLSKKLVTIKRDVDLPVSLTDLTMQDANKAILIDWFKELEFKTWLKELLNDMPEVASTLHHNIITNDAALTSYIVSLEKSACFSFDLLTTSSDYLNTQLVGIAICEKENHAVYLPIGHDDEQSQLTQESVLTLLKPILENPLIQKISQNVKYALKFFAHHDIYCQGIAYDTTLESYVLDSTGNNHQADALSLKYLGVRVSSFEDIAGKGAKQIPANSIDVKKTAAFLAGSSDVIFKLHDTLFKKLQNEKKLLDVFSQIEMPLVPVLARMERRGVLIDPKKLEQHGIALQARLVELEDKATLLAGCTFNMNSPKQLQEIFYEKLHLPILQKTPTGQPSTADAVLQELSHDFELPRIIIEYRSLSKLISTYTSKLSNQIDPQTGRIHTVYQQAITATGRLSSQDPNLQNIPIRSKEGRRIREAFIAPQDTCLLSADYSQIELRLMAHISEDPNLLKAFSQHLDIHRATAAEVWSVPLEEVTNDMRRSAKAINFGLIYGMSAFGLARQLKIDRKSAQEYIERYFTRYPLVARYMENTRKSAKEKGYVETLWGRRLYLPDINASQIPRQKAAERMAINAPLQGSAADIIKLAMIHIDHWIEEEQVPVSMIMQVHDELVFEVNKSDCDEVSKIIQHHMSHVVELKVPILVSVGIGENWDKASEH